MELKVSMEQILEPRIHTDSQLNKVDISKVKLEVRGSTLDRLAKLAIRVKLEVIVLNSLVSSLVNLVKQVNRVRLEETILNRLVNKDNKAVSKLDNTDSKANSMDNKLRQVKV